MDNASTKTFPKPYQLPQKLKTFPALKMHFGGLYYYNGKRTKYYIYPEHWSESSNTVISTFLRFLQENEESGLPKSLILIVDNHSTQKNNCLICFLDYLVRVKKKFEQVLNVFIVSFENNVNLSNQSLRLLWCLVWQGIVILK